MRALRPAAVTASLLLLLLVGLLGCAGSRIPVWPMMSPQQSLEVLNARTRQITTVSGQGTLRLTRGRNESVILEAACALKPPDSARIRAWKFGRAVFDLTVLPDAVYLAAANESPGPTDIALTGRGAAEMIRSWLGMTCDTIQPQRLEHSRDTLVAIQPISDDLTLRCAIDRRTLTVRSYQLLDHDGREQFSLLLDRYIESNGQVWPTRIVARSRTGTLRLELRDLQINQELAQAAFQPPARAEKLP
ncbi:hypothetical protein [Fontivita pretiosa]|uniref:hypothetical protein n=1 Tax=Fontivita pretiosa TaxID=2989684 RepID=UPI003D1778CA